jgi:uncharacterized protein (DUF433 family)
MTMTPVRETHIYLDEGGKGWVRRAGVSVRELIESFHAYGGKAEELVRHFPHLTLSEVYAALTHYYDHRAEIDEEIKRGREFAEQLRKETPEGEATKRLRAAGQIP